MMYKVWRRNRFIYRFIYFTMYKYSFPSTPQKSKNERAWFFIIFTRARMRDTSLRCAVVRPVLYFWILNFWWHLEWRSMKFIPCCLCISISKKKSKSRMYISNVLKMRKSHVQMIVGPIIWICNLFARVEKCFCHRCKADTLGCQMMLFDLSNSFDFKSYGFWENIF